MAAVIAEQWTCEGCDTVYTLMSGFTEEIRDDYTVAVSDHQTWCRGLDRLRVEREPRTFDAAAHARLKPFGEPADLAQEPLPTMEQLTGQHFCRCMSRSMVGLPPEACCARSPVMQSMWRQQLRRVAAGPHPLRGPAAQAELKAACRKEARRLRLLRLWRGIARAVGPLLAAQRRAAERVYAPSGAGYQAAAASFTEAAASEAAPRATRKRRSRE